MSDRDPTQQFSDALEALRNYDGLKMSHAGVVLGVSAGFDFDLERALLAKMQPISANVRERLFGGRGPLNTFSAKIDLAFALGILNQETFEALLIVKQIRNRFAHSKKILRLDSDDVYPFFKQLLKPGVAYNKHPLRAFMECIEPFNDFLELFLVEHGITDEISAKNKPNAATPAEDRRVEGPSHGPSNSPQ